MTNEHSAWTSELTQERLDAVTKKHNENWEREASNMTKTRNKSLIKQTDELQKNFDFGGYMNIFFEVIKTLITINIWLSVNSFTFGRVHISWIQAKNAANIILFGECLEAKHKLKVETK